MMMPNRSERRKNSRKRWSGDAGKDNYKVTTAPYTKKMKKNPLKGCFGKIKVVK